MNTPLCLDETLTSPARTKAALDLGACAVVNVKVGRVGGLAATKRIHDLCVERGVPMWCGGMLETGIGRAHNIHVATMPGFVYPGDTASASRTYARDITEQALEATDGIMPVPPGTGHRRHARPAVPRHGDAVRGGRRVGDHRVPRAANGRRSSPRCRRSSAGVGRRRAGRVNMLVATVSEGGMAIGAFDGDRLVGSVYGFATSQPDVLHSHYLAVDPDYRRTGLGDRPEAPAARVVPGQRTHADALDVRSAAARQRPPQPALARRHRRRGTTPTVRPDGWYQRRPAQRSIGRRMGSRRPRFAGTRIGRGRGAACHAPTRSRPRARRRCMPASALRDALLPLFADGWVATDVDRDARTYTLSR